MKLTEIIEQFDLNILAGDDALEREVNGGYASDMLSDVLTNADQGDVWVTVQKHPNIIAIAGMKDIAAIIIINGRRPDDETLEQANTEKLPVLGTEMSAFEIVGKLYQLGIQRCDAAI